MIKSSQLIKVKGFDIQREKQLFGWDRAGQCKTNYSFDILLQQNTESIKKMVKIAQTNILSRVLLTAAFNTQLLLITLYVVTFLTNFGS